ncbi:PREDICTED: maestro heat-like repeat-containing protein family member 7 [Calidris pugnax]|uniref:maestro heat-like repeat-containing protein family member 7 n=1 Tax=Calidris pugnax TaxID=198806 RepID=UPI00071DCD0C|nr:PREDICTED: maestro heat-like repeat-containing protein family member 7 [Calidris pugnax]
MRDSSPSTVASYREEKSLDIIRSRPKDEVQKLEFLNSVCTTCNAISVDSTEWYKLYFSQLEVAETIEELLQEEPTGQLNGVVRQHAMFAIASMSRAKLLLPEKKSTLLHACFCSLFHLPPQDTEAPTFFLYSRTLAAMDSMLQTLVCSAGTLSVMELKNILQLLLSFASSQTAVVQERAIARIGKLAEFLTICSLPQTHEFEMLGKLVGHLILCCTCKDRGTHHEAAEALYHLHTFAGKLLGRWTGLHDTQQLQVPKGWPEKQSCHSSQSNYAFEIFLRFMKYLQPTDRVDVILTAIKSLRAPSAYSFKVAARMVDFLVVNSVFRMGQVLNIVWAIYGNLPTITVAVARKSVDRALLVLTNRHPTWVVTGLLQCSPMCNQYGAHQLLGLLSHWERGPDTLLRDVSPAILQGVPADRAPGPHRVAGDMWKTMFSEPQAAKKVLQELLSMLMSQSQRKISTSTRDNPRILSLAATETISKILLHPTCLREVHAIFPRLFLALLLQVSFTTELMVQEVQIFWKEHQQDLLTPIRSAVKAMKELLCVMGFETQVVAIEAQDGWDALLSTLTHLRGVRTVAREMMTTQRPLRYTIFRHLVELLSVEDPTWEMVAMTFFIEMLGSVDLGEDLACALELFPMYLQSQCVGMPNLVLQGILKLTERPDVARKTLVLLPDVMEHLQGDDSTVALAVLINMLRLLKGKESSPTALALAEKLQPFFDDESNTVRQLSIRLFRDTMGRVVGPEKKKMRRQVWGSLLPLLFHLHEEDESVAKASQEALCSAGQFLKWRPLAELTEPAQAWRMSECLLARKKNKAKDYLQQSQPYLQSLQESLRLEAVRFIGLIGRQANNKQKMEQVTEILERARKDSSPLVSSLADQTLLILKQVRQRWKFRLQWPSSWLRRAQ